MYDQASPTSRQLATAFIEINFQSLYCRVGDKRDARNPDTLVLHIDIHEKRIDAFEDQYRGPAIWIAWIGEIGIDIVRDEFQRLPVDIDRNTIDTDVVQSSQRREELLQLFGGFEGHNETP
jgi:hypothetical protein